MKQKIIVTIDTEGHQGKDPIEKLIFGKTVKGNFGIERIMEEFEKINVHILFFLDFAEAWDYGKANIKKVIDCIVSRGHDIGVHIHPDHMMDKNRLFLWEYTYEEQEKIIKKCTDLYIRLVGKKPLSFRAGKYSANHYTLDILNKLGYKYDFSMFYMQKWCKIDPPITINCPVKYKDIIEIPVTMHRTFKIFNYAKFDKIDVESMTCSEISYALNQVIKQPYPIIITLFLHSFSLLDWYKNPDNPKKSNKKIKKLRNAIKVIQNNQNLEFISEQNLQNIILSKSSDALKQQIIWKSKIRGIFYLYQKLKLISKRNKNAKKILYFFRLLLIIIILIIIIIFSIIKK